MPRRVKLTVAYDGTAYAGWQIQPNGPTDPGGDGGSVLARILQEPVRVRAAGPHRRRRARAGAGRRFRRRRRSGPRDDRPRRERPSPSRHPHPLRRGGSGDVRREAPRDGEGVPVFPVPFPVDSPFLSRYAWHIETPLDLDAVREGLSHLVGEHDFSSFRGQGCNAISPVRTIFRAEVAKHDVPGLFSIDVAGAGFLRHMVRNIVGTVVNAGKGKHSADHVGEILRARDRSAAGVNAPPHGLFLWRVSY